MKARAQVEHPVAEAITAIDPDFRQSRVTTGWLEQPFRPRRPTPWEARS